jgi:prepilin-type N-terminal cleavage/methylation domain-containing protein
MKRGFSLLEMVVVVAIIVIMTMVMFVISFKDRSSKELEAVGREVSAAVREAQNNALTGRQRDNDLLPCSFAFILNGSSGYSIRGTQRTVDTFCPTDTDVSAYGVPFLSVDVSSNDMSITGHDSRGRVSDHVIFTVPYGKYYDSGTQETVPSTGTDFVIKKNKEDKKFHVCVYSTGLIEELGFNDSDIACPFY